MSKRKLPGGRILRKSRLRKKNRTYMFSLLDMLRKMYHLRPGLVDLLKLKNPQLGKVRSVRR